MADCETIRTVFVGVDFVDLDMSETFPVRFSRSSGK
jgi:hypothetical protein